MKHKPYTSRIPSLFAVLKWQISKRLSPPPKHSASVIVEHHDTMPSGEYALWLGHATLSLALGNKTIIIDPVLGNIPLYKRHTPLPIPKEKIHCNILLLTHAHYDHFDKASVLALLRMNPDLIIVAPMGFWRYLKGAIARDKCFELEWWESVMIGELFITLTPSQHWSKRTPFDTNKALWGGYVIQNKEHVIYHSGDSASGEHFKEIGEKFEIDEAFLPIGAYRPETIMKHHHTNPLEALSACEALGAKVMIPIHYGTFQLSDEPLNEPLEWFQNAIQEKRYPFLPNVLRIGEVYRFRNRSTLTST